MNHFLTRFRDCLIFENTENLFSFNEAEEEHDADENHNNNKNPIFETSNPISTYFTSFTNFQQKRLSHIFQSPHIPNYLIGTHLHTLLNTTESIGNSLISLINRLITFLDDSEFFREQYSRHFVEMEKEFDYIETQLQIVEKKLKWYLWLADFKLMDTRFNPIIMGILRIVYQLRIGLYTVKKAALVMKELHDSEVLGLKQVVAACDEGMDSSAPVLHRFDWGNSSITLRFFTSSSRDGK